MRFPLLAINTSNQFRQQRVDRLHKRSLLVGRHLDTRDDPYLSLLTWPLAPLYLFSRNLLHRRSGQLWKIASSNVRHGTTRTLPCDRGKCSAADGGTKSETGV